MQTRECFRFAEYRDRERNEELIGVLTAISIVSRRLAARLIALECQRQLKTDPFVAIEN